LSIRQVVSLLRLVLPRRRLTRLEAIAMVQHQLARNRAARRSHVRRHRAERSRPMAPT
jgi:hypothetical protein